MHSYSYRAWAALFSGLLLTAPAFAQVAPKPAANAAQDKDTVNLSVFEVKTDKDIGYQSENAAEATRMNTPIRDIPMNVTVFNQQLIEDLIATDTSQLFAYEASTVKTTENDGFLARGSASVGSNFLDGFPQTGGFGSQPVFNVERVEYIRGPAAVLYGSGGYGGIINRVSKSPRPNMSTAARMIFSDDHSMRFEFDENIGTIGALGDKVSARVAGTVDRGYTWFGQRKWENGLAASVAWQISDKTKLIGQYFYDWTETQASWETPMRAGNPKGFILGNGTFRETPRNTAWIEPEDFRRNTRQVGALDLRHTFTDSLQFRGQVQYESRRQSQIETFAESSSITILNDTVLMPRRWRSLPRTTDNYRARGEMIYEVKTGPISHRLLGGAAWAQQYDDNGDYRSPGNYGGLTGAALTGDGKLTDAQAGPAGTNTFNFFPNLTNAQFMANPQLAGFNLNNIMPINLFDRGAELPVPDLAHRGPVYLNTYTTTYTANTDLYLNDLMSFFDERLFISAGVRYSDNQRKTIAYASGTLPNKVRLAAPPTAYVTADATTPSFGAVYHLNAAKTYSIYANYNKSFTPEYRSNADGGALSPEEGVQKEIGLRTSLFKGRVNLLVAYFDLLQDNVTTADPIRGTGYFIQLNGQRSTGTEVTLNARPTDNWNVIGAYSYTDARSDLTGVPKDLSPKNRATFFNRYDFRSGKLKGLNASFGVIYTGERPITVATSRNEPAWGPLPSWMRYDAILGYSFKPGRKFTVNTSIKVTNVFNNTDMYYVASYFRYTIDPGRTWQAVVGVKF